MEKLLHYIWKHRILPAGPLHDTAGHEVEIVDPGTRNTGGGPDFLNAKVRIGGVMWAGNVEIHLRSSDWFRHGHDTDPAYKGIVLHVAQCVDRDIRTSDGATPPQLQLDVPQYVRENYEELSRTDDFPRCHRVLPDIPAMKVHAWMDALLAERLRGKAEQVAARVRHTGGDWERAAFVTLARNFGFGLNGDSFERWAFRLPLGAAGKHRDNLVQIEALFLGQAGLIDAAGGMGQERAMLWRREHAFLTHKFGLPEPMGKEQWKYLRTRPQNFPHVRMLQLAALFHGGHAGMSALLETGDAEGADSALACPGLTMASRRLLAINTVAPLLYAYGMHQGDEAMMQRAHGILERLPAEENAIMRIWRQCGIRVDNAADSQALIQLKSQYCDRKDCLRCRFAYEYLKRLKQ